MDLRVTGESTRNGETKAAACAKGEDMYGSEQPKSVVLATFYFKRERWKVENQEHVTSDLVVCGGKENDWLHLLGGEETCPVAGREGSAGMTTGAGGRAALPGPYQFAPFLLQVRIHQTVEMRLSPWGGSRVLQ